MGSAQCVKINGKDVVVFIFFDTQGLELQEKYPEQKPVCFNYAEARKEIFILYREILDLRLRLFRLDTAGRKLTIGRWTITIRKEDMRDQTGDSEMAGGKRKEYTPES